MRMTHDELREKVARAWADLALLPGAFDKYTDAEKETATSNVYLNAAIDIVLEEAAMVAEAEASVEGIAQRIAAAIRAMKKD